MDFRESLVDSITNNQASIIGNARRYAPFAQVVVGLFLAVFGYYIGKDHLQLIRHGVRAAGVIVDYKTQTFRDSSRNFTSTGFMPIVQFAAGDRAIRFKDWLGSNSRGVLGKPVIVLYDPANPSTAMIDRPVWNWIPWGPALGVGLFLILVGIRGVVRAPS